MVESNSEVISSKESMLENLRAMREIQRSYVEKIKSLSLRPEECQINSCPFIKEAYEHKDAPERLAEIENNIEAVNLFCKSENKDIDYNKIARSINYIKEYVRDIYKYTII